MYTIEIENECSCFKKSGFENNMTFESREDMINKARVMECRMNQEFCMKHFFEAVDYDNKIIIHSSLRPVDDDDDDIRELMRRNPVTIGFDDGETPPSGGGSCAG
ncbi:hypothetical protein HUE87_03740 [Candidatus Sulfurimonas marisnigri]|uniref:Uncharacterized protein n=1 Tax=Candidatus Sulfurimonas marisnigri TaxID=2740405 RepID=A0A7S7RR46_9BACT|nr:hypothetical protein [Candidatus Sulfurimonas marisnigri]QOY55361.1 hypothetical protein HUE87_03740 [Candidatus Sulfurimonas marisnigri]